MSFGGGGTRAHQRRRDDRRHHHRHRQLLEEGDLGIRDRINLGGPFHSSAERQPAAANNLGRQVAALIAQNHRSMARNHGRPPQPLSLASYESSLEINPYYRSSAPASSGELRAGAGEPSHGVKASSELLKVLNRIWALEERHESDMSLVKALKIELNHARAKIKEQAHSDNLKEELEDERRLRRRSEGLHRGLAREMFEVKVALSTSLKQNEGERRSRRLLEELCDEFAKGIIEYEREIRDLRRRNGGIWNESGDRRIVQMSESWLDERGQMKDLEGAESTAVEKLRQEIEDFVGFRRMVGSRDRRLRRNSLESMLLNEAGSAPRCAGNEDSATSSFHLLRGEAGEAASAAAQQGGALPREGDGAVDRTTTRRDPSSPSKEKLKGKLHRSRLKGSS